MRKRIAVVVASVLACAVLLAGSRLRYANHEPSAPSASELTRVSGPPALDEHDDGTPRPLRVPTGRTPVVSCEQAKAIIGHAREALAYPPPRVDTRKFATAVVDWLDAYGLWSAAPDAPVARVLEQHAEQTVLELERSYVGCTSVKASGDVLASWTAELRATFRDSRKNGYAEPYAGLTDRVFEGESSARPALTLARWLGERVGATERTLGDRVAPYVREAEARYFPQMSPEEWQNVVLAAAVRAYVQVLDPHGAWSSFDEEVSLYDTDVDLAMSIRFWDHATRTPLGLRLEREPTPPLQSGDVVLSVAGVNTGGLSSEQGEQLNTAAANASVPVLVDVFRPTLNTMVRLSIHVGAQAPLEPIELVTTRISYGAGDVAVVAVPDVRDDLGATLARALLKERSDSQRPLAGVVLDLRGNGGGSTDGAIDALGLFLPGAPLFPMKHRDGTIEVDHASRPSSIDEWNGPVATLVDGETASAAEMIAGALMAYRRGPSVGQRTFGKGCVQEYFEDVEHVGMFRLTTLLFALPDGRPVQRVGLEPTYALGSERNEALHDREENVVNAPPTWATTDVRPRRLIRTNGAWPPHGGHVGPCSDEHVCAALRTLGMATHRVATSRR